MKLRPHTPTCEYGGTKPDADGLIEVKDRDVDSLLKAGWTLADKPKPKPDTMVDEKPADPDGKTKPKPKRRKA